MTWDCTCMTWSWKPRRQLQRKRFTFRHISAAARRWPPSYSTTPDIKVTMLARFDAVFQSVFNYAYLICTHCCLVKRLRCIGIFVISTLLQSYCWVCQRQNFQHRSMIDGVCQTPVGFFDHPVDVVHSVILPPLSKKSAKYDPRLL